MTQLYSPEVEAKAKALFEAHMRSQGVGLAWEQMHSSRAVWYQAAEKEIVRAAQQRKESPP